MYANQDQGARAHVYVFNRHTEHEVVEALFLPQQSRVWSMIAWVLVRMVATGAHKLPRQREATFACSTRGCHTPDISVSLRLRYRLWRNSIPSAGMPPFP